MHKYIISLSVIVTMACSTKINKMAVTKELTLPNISTLSKQVPAPIAKINPHNLENMVMYVLTIIIG